MIGLHLFSDRIYNDHHENGHYEFKGLNITLSHHKRDTQNSFENSRVRVLLDGWIFNAPDYDQQARFIAELYIKFGLEMPAELNGQFNLIIEDKDLGKSFFVNDIFAFRKHYYNSETKNISSDIVALIDGQTRFDFDHISKNLNYTRFLDSSLTFFTNIRVVPKSSILDIETGEITSYKIPEERYGSFPPLSDPIAINKRIQKNLKEVHKNDEVLIGLSGGLDSRYLLENLLKAEVRTEALTYGIQHSDEVRLAEEVAQMTNVSCHSVYLGSDDFIEDSNEYMKAIGGLDIFPQCISFVIGRKLRSKKLTGKVLDSGFALDAFLGGTQIDNIRGGKSTGLTDAQFDFDETDIFSTDNRIFSALAYRQQMLREEIDDRYGFYHYDTYFFMKSLKADQIRNNKFYHKLALDAITLSDKVPLHATMFDLHLSLESWPDAQKTLSYRDQFVLEHFRKTGHHLFHRRYYSDFDMWLRIAPKWSEQIDKLLECVWLNKLVDSNQIQELIQEHRSGEKSNIRPLVKLISMEKFFRIFESIIAR